MAKLFGSSGLRDLANVDLTHLLACQVGLAAIGLGFWNGTPYPLDT